LAVLSKAGIFLIQRREMADKMIVRNLHRFFQFTVIEDFHWAESGNIRAKVFNPSRCVS